MSPGSLVVRAMLVPCAALADSAYRADYTVPSTDSGKAQEILA
ncbi:hypothetical protein [Nocardia araoensis]|nr:hypothetical protein [Nocardia araoensis]